MYLNKNFQEEQKELTDLVDDKINSISRIGHYRESYERIVEALTYVYYMGVSGNIAEFGTWTGRTSIILSHAFTTLNQRFKSYKLNSKRELYFFDSFKGLPEITSSEDLASEHVKAGTWKKGSMMMHDHQTFKELISNFAMPNTFNVIPGYFSEVVPSIAKEVKFGFIHCDVDLYSSTIDCLTPLFANKAVTEGCIILFDDWNCSRASNNVGQRKAFRDICDKFDVDCSDEGAYSYHGRSFIIHNYSL